MSGNPQLDTQIITAIFSVMTGVMTAAVMAPVLKASGQAYGGSYLHVTSDGTLLRHAQLGLHGIGGVSWAR